MTPPSKDWEAQAEKILDSIDCRSEYGYEGAYIHDSSYDKASKAIVELVALAASEARRDAIEECAKIVDEIEYDPCCECEPYCSCSNYLISPYATANAIRALAKAPASGKEGK